MGPEPLPHLPSEIWMMILESLPPSFFQQDIRRLALSKRWYSLAFPIFYPRIEYTPRVISRLVHRKSKSLDRSRAMLRKSLRCVNIVLDGVPGEDAELVRFNTPANLARFCLMLLEFRELDEVRFAARWPNRAWPADPLQPDYLCIRTLEPYLSVLTHVTALDLDLCGTDIVACPGPGHGYGYGHGHGHGDGAAATPVHFCEHVRPLLSRLRALRLRMRSICHTALVPLDGRPVTLRQLRLSLYLGRVSENNPKLNSSRTCPRAGGSRERTVPMNEMRAAMRALVVDMAPPARAEMVHLAPTGEIHVWDAGTDRCSRDPSEKPMRFPLCFEATRSRFCFSTHADDLASGDHAGVGGMLSSSSDDMSN
ncbi:uncharacterized protein P884DRAFT_263715 [Thermothelomyces heterothallicus CBS 202.75]|uniref:uncharacterized protein n=1 Tax=Thermothelomyces heterothallicus CBS 202.75 TaxID=1149848 RepID=UPI003742F492